MIFSIPRFPGLRSSFLFQRRIQHCLLSICSIVTMPPPQPIPTFRQSVILISCLAFRTLQRYFLSFKCLKVMVSLARVLTAAYLLRSLFSTKFCIQLQIFLDLSLSCACFGLCVPLPFMPSYVWAKWRQPITTNLSHQLITSLSLLMLLTFANHVVSLKVTFLHYKHSYNQPPFSVIIQRQSSFCPVQFMLDDLKSRGDSRGPLFTIGGLPVHRQYFCGLLTTAIKRCDLNPARYKGHSFRIGAASHAAQGGMYDAQIRVLGRWKSNAFLRYIRISSLSSTNQLDSFRLMGLTSKGGSHYIVGIFIPFSNCYYFPTISIFAFFFSFFSFATVQLYSLLIITLRFCHCLVWCCISLGWGSIK